MARSTVVIIGASSVGLPAAHTLLQEPSKVRVVLINPSPEFYFNVAAPRIFAKPKAFRADQYLLSIEDGFAQYPKESFEFIVGTATAIDVTAKSVSVSAPGSDNTQSVSYDYLLIASGATTPATTGSVTGSSIPFKAPGRTDTKELIVAAQEQIANAKSIVIGGAGPIGVELAGELAEAVEQSGNAGKVSITLVSATDRVLQMLKPSASSAAEKMLKQKNVKVITGTRVLGAEASKDDSSSWTVSLDNNEKLSTDVYIPTTGSIPNNSFIPEQFLDQDGWVKVTKELRVESAEAIYAAGDITNNTMRLAFKAGEQARIAANNIKVDIAGKGERKVYDQGTSVMMVVPIGEAGGTGQIFGFVPWSFMVRMVKGKDYFVSKAPDYLSGKA
ncbi:Apoptosis-inducing factor [Penicillium capsulatum]|uniref:Apoptosis-inducing factor n=1 Tax=Penicillium capsulatum TaxID=69766 RepID=A0A9W9I1S3_9EURO|nr:Apoptosis-inducing factor [Penicillium capsulatum]KAJ6117154.1 Apoptosis-inducing factor [Penicillium capsulatum]